MFIEQFDKEFVSKGQRPFSGSDRVRGELDGLLAKAKQAEQAHQFFNWRGPVDPPSWLPRKTYVDMLSQLMHGEDATTRVLRHLQPMVPDASARAFLETQIADEERHQGLYARYLGRLGDIAPADESVQQAFTAGLDWKGPWQGIVIACHIVLEGEALKLQQDALSAFKCPLLRQVSRRVMLDEARHVAFGKLYAEPMIAQMPADERYDIYVWIKQLWHNASAVGWRRNSAVYGIFKHAYMRKHWATHARSLRAIGLIQPGDRFGDDA